MSLRPFHLAFPVHDLAAARAFYGETMGCREGRSSAEWVDFDFYGHQIVAHLAPGEAGDRANNHVDGHGVPVPHFGVVLAMADWQRAGDEGLRRRRDAVCDVRDPSRRIQPRSCARSQFGLFPRLKTRQGVKSARKPCEQGQYFPSR